MIVQVASAKDAATKVESELGDLKSTLKNIEDARPFDQLTVRPMRPVLLARHCALTALGTDSSTTSPRRAPRSPRRSRTWFRRASGPCRATPRVSRCDVALCFYVIPVY